ncbi:nuclear transport factor 2 family protein [Vacuolonema iberomarrocanum]|uniref:nuclear transport factor 2 family protein n=1 Tax=Vacuolonema iberomarrocanum TaxID=3454632 RepID=UPI0019EF8942|nr:nuclear transport factor 2 family protein [filamentous cyanobacterium LEGE 07170]
MTSDRLSANDQLAIHALNSRYFYTLDGLTFLIPGDAAENWADTFTPDGRFSIVRWDREVVMEVSGRKALADAFRTFPDIETTRHWSNNFFIVTDGAAIKSGCYIVAMDIKQIPARLERTGLYEDELAKVGDAWKFKSRTLILDPASPGATDSQRSITNRTGDRRESLSYTER